ncbi:DUF6701 domain-containing protein [Aquabacterium sp. OR-4]|uniref:DUF6701 domain-containing protein n=1 Tax=Aquabacterium sp. OR-4 TaxID=2978127 RepID=UPI0028C5FB12|nr:DUF6701 domain-containing protein [Aquabacterium sp. OR-4]MDT7836889.1 hypothetical protein [Aquabacterium sp. OR-4]
MLSARRAGWRPALWLAGLLLGLGGLMPAAQAAITEVVWGTFATSSSGNVSSATVPTRGIGATLATGDVGIAVISLRTTGTVTPPAGWTLLADRSEGGTLRSLVYLRVITNPSTEPTTHTWSFPATRVVASGMLLRGVDTANPVQVGDSWGDAGSGNVVTLPGITSSSDGVLQFGVSVLGNAPASFSTPSGSTERVDTVSNNASSGVSHAIHTRLEASAGSLNTARSSTATLGGPRIGFMLGLNPAPPAPTLHRIEIRHGSGQGLTCQASTLTVVACANAACTSFYNGGVNGVLTATGSGQTVNWPDGASFDIAPGSHTVSKRIQQTTAGSTTLGVQFANPAAGCNFGSPACTWTSRNSGFVFDVPDHVAGSPQSLEITAVTPGSGSTACAGSFASAQRDLVFRCTPLEPASGTRAVSVNGQALNATGNANAACDGSGRSLRISFDHQGRASLPVSYGDAGRVRLSATYTGSSATGDSGLVISGSDSFIAAPAWFKVAAQAGPLRAGSPFSATVTAHNAAGAAMPNYGRENNPEAVTLGFVRLQPTGSGAVDGSFSGTRTLASFSGGAASVSDLAWSEVGRGDLVARLANPSYLDSGLRPVGSSAGDAALACALEGGNCSLPGGGSATLYFGSASGWVALPGRSGSQACSAAALGEPGADSDRSCLYVPTSGSATGSVGDFIPHHLLLSAANACGSFTYAGQPLAATLTARNAAGGVTRNFDGSSATTPGFAQAITLAAAGSPGPATLSGASVAPSAFNAGVASATPSVGFAQKATAPMALGLRASNSASGGAAISSDGQPEPTLNLRSGRLRLANAFGSARSALQLPLTVEYWSGQAWLVNSADSCSTLLPGAVALSRPRDALGQASDAATAVSALSLAAGRGVLTLAAPTPAGRTLTVDIALNLGALSADQACQGSQPATVGAGLPWLRSHNGACAATADRDPAGRASFGIHSPEHRKLVHVRDLY